MIKSLVIIIILVGEMAKSHFDQVFDVELDANMELAQVDDFVDTEILILNDKEDDLMVLDEQFNPSVADFDGPLNNLQEQASTSLDQSDRSIQTNEVRNIKQRACKSGCDNTNLYVQPSSQRSSDKKHFCYFCHKRYSKIARHYETVHRNEEEVKKFSVLPKGIYYNNFFFTFRTKGKF